MIYTVTFNPSLDYIVTVEHFTKGIVNRTTEELMLPGGKGINVSIVLKNLGTDSIALGFMAGFTGREIERLLSEQDVHSDFIPVDEGISRINVKLRSDEESEINGMGPAIKDKDIKLLYEKLDKLVGGDTLIISGSIPSVMPGTMYEDIMAHLQGRGIRIVVDATKDLLTNVLPYHPFMVKPNNHELGEIYGVTLKTKEETIPYAKKMKEAGAQNVLVSMAGEGALLVADDGNVYQSATAGGKVKNSVGAGDSMVAGFVDGYLRTENYETAFYEGLCTGSASAYSDFLATKDEVNALLKKMGREAFCF